MDPFGADPFGADAEDAFAVFDGKTMVGHKRPREEETQEDGAKESITDGLLNFGATGADGGAKTKETEELEQIAAHEKSARRRCDDSVFFTRRAGCVVVRSLRWVLRSAGKRPTLRRTRCW